MEVLFIKDWLKSLNPIQESVYERFYNPKGLDVEKELSKMLLEKIEKSLTPDQKQVREDNDRKLLEEIEKMFYPEK